MQKPAQSPTESRAFKVLLAYDGSSHARAGAELLADLVHAQPSCLKDCQLTVLAVMPTQYITGHEQLQAAVNQVSNLLAATGLQVDSVLKAGNPAASINDLAVEIDADLVMIGAKGLRAALGIFLGGVAQQVVEYSDRPVLVVREPYRKWQRVLLVTDGSASSREAASYLAAREGEGKPQRFPIPAEVEFHVMHVLPPSFPTEITMRAWAIGPEALYQPPIEPPDVEALEAQEEAAGQQLLKKTAAVLEKGGIDPQLILRRGDAASEIIDYIQEKQMDLVICGSRGLSQVAGWLLGSVSRKLLHYADCSVLVVK